jgi:hypothetical protein
MCTASHQSLSATMDLVDQWPAFNLGYTYPRGNAKAS